MHHRADATPHSARARGSMSRVRSPLYRSLVAILWLHTVRCSLLEPMRLSPEIQRMLQHRQAQGLSARRRLDQAGDRKHVKHTSVESSARRRLYSDSVYPQRNEEYPIPVFARYLPRVKAPEARVEQIVITGQVPEMAWLVSSTDWAPGGTGYNSEIIFGAASYAVDGDMLSQVHLKFDGVLSTFIIFNLFKAHQIAGIRVRPAWSNGPRKIKIFYSSLAAGPWYFAAEAEVAGKNGGSYIMERWNGKVVEGYRDHDLRTTITFPAGRLVSATFFKLEVLSVYEGVYAKGQAVIKELEFYGQELITPLNAATLRQCPWGTLFNEETGRCQPS